MKRTAGLVVVAFACSAMLPLVAPQISAAAGYPTNACVSKKTRASAKFCSGVLKAWSQWHRNPTDEQHDKRIATIQNLYDKLGSSFTKAEASATSKGSDCVETTATATQIGSEIEAAIDALPDVNAQSMGPHDHACRAKALSLAATLCQKLLYAQAKYIGNPGRDSAAADRTADQNDASLEFTSAYDAEDAACPDTLLSPSASVLADIDAINDDVTTDTTTSPNAPLSFVSVYPATTVPYLGKDLHPRCSKNTPYRIQYKRGTVNKLLMFYMGGGACWSRDTCWTVGTYTPDVDSGNDITEITTGFADPDNMLNIFRDWHVIFVSYCTGDVHWGDNVQTYGSGQTTFHRGRVNAAFAEKWAREHFLDPEFVFVTGSSAGSYGAIMNSTYLMHDVYPQVEHAVLGDAGIGVITQPFLERYLSNTSTGPGTGQNVWGIDKNLPTFIPGISENVSELSMPQVIEALAAAFPNNRFASYESAYDGGNGGQTSFYHIMKNQDDINVWLDWHQDQCEWTACMRQFSQTIAASSPNYRYYTGAGSRHTIYGSDKLYTDTRGLVPPITFRDWVNAMINDDVGWVSLDCQDGGDCDLVDTCQGGSNAGLPCANDGDCSGGTCELDPRPDPLAAPYEPGGAVNCPATSCPCGPTGVNCP